MNEVGKNKGGESDPAAWNIAGELAPYATRVKGMRGRLHPEPESATRNPFQRDRDRIIHSTAFRRLQYKTQVFVYHEGDHYRTRLTHSLEDSQIARSICRTLHLNENIGEALALAHDLGHTPFGHAGEEELNGLMEGFGGFDHNAQTLRILTKLESRYLQFEGLNLTWETLEGVVKHNGPLLQGPQGQTTGDLDSLPTAISEYAKCHDLALDTHAGPEAQVAALSDDIAYNNHDIDDGIRAGLFSIHDMVDVPLAGPVFRQVIAEHGAADSQRITHEAVRRLIGIMVDDLLLETKARLAAAKPKNVTDIRALGRPVVAFSETMQQADRELKAFLYENMYRHWRVNRMTAKARRVVKDLFTLYMAQPTCLPPEWSAATDGPGGQKTARRVADFIAGMTDRFAMEEHRRLFDMDVPT